MIHFLLILTVTFLFSFNSQAVVTIRAPGSSVQDYHQFLKSHPGRLSPKQIFEQTYTSAPLPAWVQEEAAKAKALENITDREQAFSNLIARVKKLSPSLARRRTLLALYNEADWKDLAKEAHPTFKSGDSWTQSEEQKEMLNLIQSLKRQSGGEDLDLYVNGQAWSETWTFDLDQVYQWQVFSSQWSLQTFEGTQNAFKQWVQTEYKPSSWVTGSSTQYKWTQLSFLQGQSREVFWGPQNITTDEWSNPMLASYEGGRKFKKPATRYWVLGAAILTTLLISHELQDKEIVFDF